MLLRTIIADFVFARDNGLAREEWWLDSCPLSDGPLVMSIWSIDQRHERTGIDDDPLLHRP